MWPEQPILLIILLLSVSIVFFNDLSCYSFIFLVSEGTPG